MHICTIYTYFLLQPTPPPPGQDNRLIQRKKNFFLHILCIPKQKHSYDQQRILRYNNSNILIIILSIWRRKMCVFQWKFQFSLLSKLIWKSYQWEEKRCRRRAVLLHKYTNNNKSRCTSIRLSNVNWIDFLFEKKYIRFETGQRSESLKIRKCSKHLRKFV